MSLRIEVINDDSILSAHDVQVGDELAHINAWAVRTKSDARIAYKTSNLDLVFLRKGKTYTVQLVADDLGITVKDENNEIFKMSINELGNVLIQESVEAKPHQKQSTTSNSVTFLKVIAWILFIFTAIGSVVLLNKFAVVEVPGRYGVATHQFNAEIIAIVVVSLMSSGFLLALSYSLAYVHQQLRAVRKDIIDMNAANGINK